MIMLVTTMTNPERLSLVGWGKPAPPIIKMWVMATFEAQLDCEGRANFVYSQIVLEP